jgi:hypothetical protein
MSFWCNMEVFGDRIQNIETILLVQYGDIAFVSIYCSHVAYKFFIQTEDTSVLNIGLASKVPPLAIYWLDSASTILILFGGILYRQGNTAVASFIWFLPQTLYSVFFNQNKFVFFLVMCFFQILALTLNCKLFICQSSIQINLFLKEKGLRSKNKLNTSS